MKKLDWFPHMMRRGIYVPQSARQDFPYCLKCRALCDKVQLEEEKRLSVDIRAWHHGEEDVIRVTFQRPYDESDIARVWRNLTFFVPDGSAGLQGEDVVSIGGGGRPPDTA